MPPTRRPNKRPAGDAASPLDHAVTERDRGTQQMVREAVATGDVALAFQPVVQARAPDQVAFYEGLIRIIDETGRIIPACDFMHTVETNELGRQIDCLSLDMGLQTLAENPEIRLSINMSARSIGYEPWLRILRRALRRDGTLGDRLILEITESSAMLMPELVVSFMDDLQSKGIAFALDDFGAGYTAFRYFKEFFFDVVKIDGQFIQGIHKDTDNQVLTKSLLSIAQHFEMFTVAENVENAADAAYLARMGIDCLQGFYFGAPTTGSLWKLGEAQSRSA